MDDKAIFERLFEESGKSKDSRGIVVSCLVRDGEITTIAVSSDDGKSHAENIILSGVANVHDGSILYCTLEPCSKRSDPTMMDCVSDIIRVSIKEVVYGARDPKQSEVTKTRLNEAGVILRQVEDAEIIKKCAEIFNDSVAPELVGNGVDLKPLE